MPDIKKYLHVHPTDTRSFDIKRMEDIYAKTGGAADEPHRHDYYIILLVRQAKGKHIIDFHEFELGPNQVYFISPGQVHQIVEEAESIGYALTFSQQFLSDHNIDWRFIESVHLFQDYGFTPPLELTDSEMAELGQMAQSIETYFQSNQKFKLQAIAAVLQLLLIEANHFCLLNGEQNTQSVQASVTLLRDFKDLINAHFTEWHKVSEYASAMAITPDYLNNSIKSLTDKTAKEHTQSRITTAAKRMLRFTELTSKEIAYELGFSEPANFSQFFKKCTGLSPMAFRKSA